MNILLMPLLFTTSIFGITFGSPHEIILDCRDSIIKSCIECHNSENITSTSCLSCHDGVSGSYMNFITPENENSSYLHISPSLEKGHPVEVEYLEGGVRGLKTKNSKISEWNCASKIDDLLINVKITCASCHDPHNKRWPKYLRRTNAGSELCFTCHNK
ncbi:cytochrome c3 family protein [Sulfurimonas sp.]|uniref:cytochrome c3 family protein n=1 Tax=Sulfurimonas sp. TaxID=2022749 RepID=UPI0025DCC5F8|nr:cytochrome c3 family protein [Sulfurimonas sp.]MCK9474141.1 cytochrome c3 family protein [Sulfurimonas sp.]MDD3506780.1 cytochrome c3 family protein [Sulfurimonas sp.]